MDDVGAAAAKAGGEGVRLVRSVRALERIVEDGEKGAATKVLGFMWGKVGARVDRETLPEGSLVAWDITVVDNFPEWTDVDGRRRAPMYNYRLDERVTTDPLDLGAVLWHGERIGGVLGLRGKVVELDFATLPPGLRWPEGETPNTSGLWGYVDAADRAKALPATHCARCGLELIDGHVCPERDPDL